MGFFFFLLNCNRSLYILNRSPLTCVYTVNMSQYLALSFSKWYSFKFYFSNNWKLVLEIQLLFSIFFSLWMKTVLYFFLFNVDIYFPCLIALCRIFNKMMRVDILTLSLILVICVQHVTFKYDSTISRCHRCLYQFSIDT